MKTSIYTLLEEARKYQKESGNDSISIDLLEQGINGIYGNLEKKQIIDAVTHGNRMEFYDATETAGEQYYTSTFETNKETLK